MRALYIAVLFGLFLLILVEGQQAELKPSALSDSAEEASALWKRDVEEAQPELDAKAGNMLNADTTNGQVLQKEDKEEEKEEDVVEAARSDVDARPAVDDNQNADQLDHVDEELQPEDSQNLHEDPQPIYDGEWQTGGDADVVPPEDEENRELGLAIDPVLPDAEAEAEAVAPDSQGESDGAADYEDPASEREEHAERDSFKLGEARQLDRRSDDGANDGGQAVLHENPLEQEEAAEDSEQDFNEYNEGADRRRKHKHGKRGPRGGEDYDLELSNSTCVALVLAVAAVAVAVGARRRRAQAAYVDAAAAAAAADASCDVEKPPVPHAHLPKKHVEFLTV